MKRLVPILVAAVLINCGCCRKTLQTTVADTHSQLVADRIVRRIDSLIVTRSLAVTLDSPRITLARFTPTETLVVGLRATSLTVSDSSSAMRVGRTADNATACTRVDSHTDTRLTADPTPVCRTLIAALIVVAIIGLTLRGIRSRR